MILIVFPDYQLAEQIANMLKDFDFKSVEVAHDLEDALNKIENISPELVITDVHIKDQKQGIELSKYAYVHNFSVIYVTSDSSESVFKEAQKTDPDAYLIRPFHNFTLKSAIQSSLRYRLASNSNRATKAHLKDSFFVKSGNVLHRIKLSTIKQILSEGNYCQIITDSRKFSVKLSLAKMTSILEKHGFIRVHQSFLIPLQRISNVDLNTNLVTVENEAIAIGRSYRNELLNKIQRI